jgi:hypothetical protein
MAIVPTAAEQMLTPQQVYTSKGKATHVGEFFSVMPDCTPKGVDDFRVVMAPKHGKISKVRSEVTIHFAPPNPAARCKGRQVMSTNAVYSPTPSYVGNDAIELEILIHTGEKVLMPVNISVGGPIPPGYH